MNTATGGDPARKANMSTLHVRKEGKTKLSIPYVITNGFPNFQGKYLVSGETCKADGIDPKSLVLKAPNSKTEKYYLRMGQNPDGNLLVDSEEESRKRQDEAERKILALHLNSPRNGDNRKWGHCEKCDVALPPGYGKLRFCAADTGCPDHMDRDGWHIRCADESACAVRVPAARRAAKIRSLRDQAEHEKSVAIGALTYDADGWLSREDQEKSHATGMAKAAQLEAQAAALERMSGSAS